MIPYANKVPVASLDSTILYNMKVAERESILPDDESTPLLTGGYRCLGKKDNSQYTRIKFEEDCRKIRRAIKRAHIASGVGDLKTLQNAPGRDINR